MRAKPGRSFRAKEVLIRSTRSHFRDSLLEQRARQHRSALTPSERLLWNELRGGKLGVWFRRQVCVGDFIADFLAARARLVFEVDGGYHVGRRSADAARDRKLARLGYRVLRIAASRVERDIAEAVAVVREALARSS